MSKSQIWRDLKTISKQLRIPHQSRWRSTKAHMLNELNTLQQIHERRQLNIDLFQDIQTYDRARLIRDLQPRFETETEDGTTTVRFDNYQDIKQRLRVLIIQLKPDNARILTTITYDDGEEISRHYNTVQALFDNIEQLIDGYQEGQAFESLEFHFMVPNARPPVPPMAHSDDIINCVIKQAFDQTHRKMIMKESTGTYMNVNDILALETKFKINIYITDSFNKLWRKPEIIYPKKSQKHPVDVFIKCHDYHATKAFRVTDIIAPTTDTRVSTPGATISNFYVSGRKVETVYHEIQTLVALHLSFLRAGTEHIVIDNGTSVIGVITKTVNYKDSTLKDLRFIKENDWSISGYGKRRFKEHILNKNNTGLTYQIPDKNVYNNIKGSQSPIAFLFKPKYKHDTTNKKARVYQIDMSRAYRNSAVGNLDVLPKYFYKGFPTAPRSVETINKPLTATLLKKLTGMGLGFALISFDQTAHIKAGLIPMLHTGQPTPIGTTVLSLPALSYYGQFRKVKVIVKQYYYSKTTYEPFKELFENLDLELENTQDAKVYKQLRLLPNLIIGGINKSITKCQVFSTLCPEEAQRFLADESKIIHRWTTREFKENVKTPTNPRLTPEEALMKINFDQHIFVNTERDYEDIETLTSVYIFYYMEKGDTHADSFNQTHLSKYVTDYQKIACHAKASEVCGKKASNLICINTDSITYISSTPFVPSTYWHLEAIGSEFYGKSNGCKVIVDEGEKKYQRHGGFSRELTISEYKVMSDEHTFSVRPSREYKGAAEYDQTLENVPLPDQELKTIFRPAGYGKTELANYMSMKPSKFTDKTNGDDAVRRYDPDDILCVGTTHVARGLIGGNYTLAGIIIRFKKGVFTTAPKAILIDEISMASMGQLNSLDRVLRNVTSVNRPFGGVSIYLVGHMKQLPLPDPNAKTILSSHLFPLFSSMSHHLPVNHRQCNDEAFATILSKVENYYDVGGDEKSNEYAKNVLPEILTPDELDLLRSRLSKKVQKGQNIIPLHFKNSMVGKDNKRLGSIEKGSEVIVRFTGKFTYKGETTRFYNGEHYIIQETKLNGGKIESVKINGHWFPYKYFVVDTKEGEKHPKIQLAKSMTIHCSQGQTMDAVFLYAKSLTMNMLYVAMSRVRCLADLYLYNVV